MSPTDKLHPLGTNPRRRKQVGRLASTSGEDNCSMRCSYAVLLSGHSQRRWINVSHGAWRRGQLMMPSNATNWDLYLVQMPPVSSEGPLKHNMRAWVCSRTSIRGSIPPIRSWKSFGRLRASTDARQSRRNSRKLWKCFRAGGLSSTLPNGYPTASKLGGGSNQKSRPWQEMRDTQFLKCSYGLVTWPVDSTFTV